MSLYKKNIFPYVLLKEALPRSFCKLQLFQIEMCGLRVHLCHWEVAVEIALCQLQIIKKVDQKLRWVGEEDIKHPCK